MTLLCNRDDRVALRFWLGFGSPDWRYNQYRRLREHCGQTGDSPLETLDKMINGEIPAAGYAQILARFRLPKERVAALEDLTGTALLERLFPGDAQWAEPLHEILEGSEITDETTCADIISTLGEYITQPEVPTAPEFVRVMSLHASKGLTSKVTIVATIVDSLIPNVDTDLALVEQERTLREQRSSFMWPSRGRATFSSCPLPRELLRRWLRRSAFALPGKDEPCQAGSCERSGLRTRQSWERTGRPAGIGKPGADSNLEFFLDLEEELPFFLLTEDSWLS